MKKILITALSVVFVITSGCGGVMTHQLDLTAGVIDACFSGYSGDGKPLVKSASPLLMTVTNPLLNAKNGVVFTSSTGKQISSWYPKKQHGLFTYYFLQGLRGGFEQRRTDNRGRA